jgi:hypothetical protein
MQSTARWVSRFGRAACQRMERPAGSVRASKTPRAGDAVPGARDFGAHARPSKGVDRRSDAVRPAPRRTWRACGRTPSPLWRNGQRQRWNRSRPTQRDRAAEYIICVPPPRASIGQLRANNRQGAREDGCGANGSNSFDHDAVRRNAQPRIVIRRIDHPQFGYLPGVARSLPWRRGRGVVVRGGQHLAASSGPTLALGGREGVRRCCGPGAGTVAG